MECALRSHDVERAANNRAVGAQPAPLVERFLTESGLCRSYPPERRRVDARLRLPVGDRRLAVVVAGRKRPPVARNTAVSASGVFLRVTNCSVVGDVSSCAINDQTWPLER